MPKKPVVTNSTPLIAFWSIQRLDILQSLFGEVWIAPAVRDEFLALQTELREQSLEQNPWIRVVKLSRPARAKIFSGLDMGEAETLALAEEQDARLVLVDEKKGRQYAKRLGLRLSGSMGILLMAKENGLIEKVAPLLNAVEEAGLFIGLELKQKVLELAGE